MGGRLFPERQILLRSGGRERQLTFPGWLQAALVTTSITALAGIGYVTAEYVHASHLVRQKQAEVALAESSNADISALVDDLREALGVAETQYTAITAQYAETRHQLTLANAQNAALRDTVGMAEFRARASAEARDEVERRLRSAEQASSARLTSAAQLAKALDDNRAELRRAEEARAALDQRLQELEGELQAAGARTRELKAALGGRERQLVKLVATREAVPAGDGRAAKAPEPEASSGTSAPPARQAAGAPPAGPVRSELERLIVSTGLDIEKLLERLALPQSQGGPYVSLDAVKPRLAERRAEEVEKLAQMLPLGVPLAHYSLESTFGSRTDPFHGRQAFHAGVDLAAPYKTPVHATGPGTVIFTGVRDAYGRVVEIDHGHGIVTRYAHLHRILVARGQKVGPETEIAQLGSTGRSTGPHVHYEVLVDGVAQDPEKFMQAGRGVVQISKR